MKREYELLRTGGRIHHAEIPYDKKHPVILQSRHPLTEEIVQAFHRRHLHLGIDTILSQVRSLSQITLLDPTWTRNREESRKGMPRLHRGKTKNSNKIYGRSTEGTSCDLQTAILPHVR